MSIAMWSISALVALVMLAAGALKIVVPRRELALSRMKWAGGWSDGRVKLLGLAEVLGSVGLVVPVATGIQPILTPIAALCLTVLMVGAVKTDFDLGEPIVRPAVLGALCLVIAAGRLGIIPPF